MKKEQEWCCGTDKKGKCKCLCHEYTKLVKK